MSLLGLLNFVVLQWFCVRLQASFSCVCPPGIKHRWWDREIAVDDKVAFSLIRWIVPLTGWWGKYRFITRMGLIAWLSPTAWFNLFVAQWFFVRVGWVGARPVLVKWIWPGTGLWVGGGCMRFTDGTHLGKLGRHTPKDCR